MQEARMVERQGSGVPASSWEFRVSFVQIISRSIDYQRTSRPDLPCCAESGQPLCYLNDRDEILIDLAASTKSCKWCVHESPSGAATPVPFAAFRIRSRPFAIWCPLKLGV